MKRQQLITQLLETNEETSHLALFKKNEKIIDLKFARDLKDTYYSSWTTEPRKTRNAAIALSVLSKFLPEPEVPALAYWVQAIADLTEGKTQSAIENIDKASEIFISLDQPYHSAQTQVSKLYALALLGRYDEAVNCGQNTLEVFKKHGDELAAGKIEKNIGNIVSRQEKHFEAEKYYLSAYKRFKKLKNDSEMTMCENGLAITYSALNNFLKAENFYQKALSRAKKFEMLVTQAEIEASMGNLFLFRAKFNEALKLLELSRQKYEKLQMPHQSAVAELEMADAYLELNLVREAFEIYEKVTESLAQLKMQGEEARARLNFAKSAINLRKNELARMQLEKAAKLYKAEKNLAGEAFVKLIETQLSFSQNDYPKASKLAQQTSEMLKESGNLRYILLLKYLQGEILFNLQKTAEAEQLFNETYIEAAKQDNLFLTQAAQTALGKLSLQQNDQTKAEKYFKQAIELIENLREPLPAEDFRMSFFADKIVSYQQLANIYLKKGKIKEAFLLVEKSRSRVLAESLTENEFENKPNEVTAPLLKQLNGLREELNWFYSRLNRATADESVSLLVETHTREKQINELMRQIKNVGGEANKTNKTLDLDSLQNFLGKERALIEFVNFDGKINIFILTEKNIEFIETETQESEITNLLESLHFQFETMRYGESQLGIFAAELKKRTNFYLQKLYQKLILPIEKFIENRHLVIIPFGKLHYLPFHALFDGEHYLIEKREVSYAASALVLQHCLEKPKRELENALLVGFADEKIPFVKDEIEKLEEIFPKGKTLFGKDASFTNFKKKAESFDVIHLACHGQFRQDNPMFSALRLSDGFLTVRDISELNLKAELVTLSACETGLNKVLEGDELIGLKRGFFAAGVPSLILTLWTVNDKATQTLVADFYQNLKDGKTISDSLRTAQNKLIAEKSHPYFWSPFFLAGSW